MKRTIRCLLAALALLAAVSCMTLYDTEALQSAGDIAVVSIQANRSINAEGMDEIATAARGWARSEDFDLVPTVARIRDDLFGRYRTIFPFNLAAEKALLNSETYKGLGTDGAKLLTAREVTVPEGYLAVPLDERKSVESLIARLPDVNAFLWAEVDFTLLNKREFKGTVFVTMRADLTITVLDRRARAIVRHMEFAEDAEEMRIAIASAVRLADLASAALRATGRAGAKMAAWLQARGAR